MQDWQRTVETVHTQTYDKDRQMRQQLRVELHVCVDLRVHVCVCMGVFLNRCWPSFLDALKHLKGNDRDKG